MEEDTAGVHRKYHISYNRIQKFQNTKKMIPKVISMSNSTSMELFLIPALVPLIVSITMG